MKTAAQRLAHTSSGNQPLPGLRTVLVCLIFVQIAICFAWLPSAARGENDWRSFYYGGLQVLSGHTNQLYSAEGSRAQLAKIPDLRKDLRPDPFTHPAFQAPFFSVFARLSYRSGALAFLLFNAALIMPVTFWLMHLVEKERRADLILLVLGFLPLGFALINGQDGIMLLCVLAASTYLLNKGNLLWAGLVAGIGVFRFQLAIPILILFVSWGFVRFAAGFLISAASAVALSIATVGWQQSKVYVKLVTGLGTGRINADYAQPIAHMPNIHGFLTTIALIGGADAHSLWLTAGMALASLAVLLRTARRSPTNAVHAMVIAIPVAVLVAFQGFMSDASILLIPAALLLFSTNRNQISGLTLCLLPLTSIYRFLSFIAAVPLLVVAFTDSKGSPVGRSQPLRPIWFSLFRRWRRVSAPQCS